MSKRECAAAWEEQEAGQPGGLRGTMQVHKSLTGRELMRSIGESEGQGARAEETQLKKYLVAMRLEDTPVLIPNTMVKI